MTIPVAVLRFTDCLAEVDAEIESIFRDEDLTGCPPELLWGMLTCGVQMADVLDKILRAVKVPEQGATQ